VLDRKTTSRLSETHPTAADDPPALLASVRQLMNLRTIAVGGQVVAMAVSTALGVVLPLAPMIAVVGLLVALNLVTWFRLKRPASASHYEIAGYLALDLAAFTILLFLSGGAANPFSLLFVLHAVLVALLLPPLPAAFGTLLVLACFSLVARFNVPLRLGSGEPLPPGLLAFGHWLSLALTAAVVAWFVVRIVAALRENDRLLREAAQKAQNDETILRLGALAAGAAHELASPMTTMTVVAGEMGREANTPSLRRDVGILKAQIEACRQTISNLLAAAGHARAEGGGRERLDAFLGSIGERLRTMRPEVNLTCRWDDESPVTEIFGEQSLQQAILALLNNAADASPDDVQMTASWNADTLRVSIGDRGAGLPTGNLDKLGRVFFTTKPPGKGIGLGLVLASNAIKHLGGTLRWQSRSGGGTQADIVLPLGTLKLAEAS
jgi:two-component system, sensor histidine kinase RegB